MSTPPDKLRVLVADDHELILVGLATAIDAQPDMSVVARAVSGYEAVALYEQHLPDVAIMDVSMPGNDDCESIHYLLRTYPQSVIVLLTVSELDERIYQTILSGARGYLHKGEPNIASRVVAAIRAAHAGMAFISPENTVAIVQRSSKPRLKERLLEVLRLIEAGKTNKEIGELLNLSESGVKARVRELCNYFDATNRVKALHKARTSGYL